jgi:cell shape-determining protein MreC
MAKNMKLDLDQQRELVMDLLKEAEKLVQSFGEKKLETGQYAEANVIFNDTNAIADRRRGLSPSNWRS